MWGGGRGSVVFPWVGGAGPARYSDEAPLHQLSPGVSGAPAAKLQGPLAMMLHMDLLACVALLKDDVYRTTRR